MPLLAPPCPDPVSMTRTVYQSLNGLLNKNLNEKHTETNLGQHVNHANNK